MQDLIFNKRSWHCRKNAAGMAAKSRYYGPATIAIVVEAAVEAAVTR
jgi:hypothetical protein